MDLHLAATSPTDAERAAVDAVLEPPATASAGSELQQAAAGGRIGVGGLRARHGVRHLLLPALHGVQDAIGWISPAALNYVSERLGVPPAEAFGVATFYSLLSTTEQPPRVAHVCDDIACRGAGALELCRQLEQRLGAAHHAGAPPAAHGRAVVNGAGTAGGAPAGEAAGGDAASGQVAWVTSPCLGLCEAAPAVLLQLAGEPDDTLAPASADAVCTALSPASDRSASETAAAADGTLPRDLPPASRSVPQAADPALAAELSLLRRIGTADPASISDYRRHGGCAALRRAVEIGADGVLRELRDSKLQGRGGAAFPTAIKWEAVARAPARPRYVVCNADESEPGTFKDRVVMEQDPFALIEAMVIAGFTTGASSGYLYLRGEYPLATRRLQCAITQARDWGLLGRDVMGLGIDFDVELRRGAGAYICGEETALFNSLEGFRGEPRSKPPYPVEAGLFGKPTAINNVETLINLLPILLGGGRAYAAVGTDQSTGRKLFCLSGAVAKPGVYEVEFGTTLRELLELAGGTVGGEPRATLLGGAAGSFVGPEQLDLPLTFESTRAAGVTLGSGVVMPFAPGTDFRAVLRRIARFFRDESCGQCVPCRVGTVRQEEALARLCAGGGDADRAVLADLAQVMGDASICGLGHTAAAAVQSALTLGLLDRNGDG